jgi:hypothetical protein
MRAVGVGCLAASILATAAFVGPSSAGAFKLVKASGGAITNHTEIHFTDDAEISSLGNAFKCEVNGTFTTRTGQEADTFVINLKLITNSCVGTGLYKGCQVIADGITAPNLGKVAIDENALTFNLHVLVEFGAGCPFMFAIAEFAPLRTIVGIGAINTGIIEGKGEIETDKGKAAATASGEMTLGQYTENGVNKGAAKGVFKIE